VVTAKGTSFSGPAADAVRQGCSFAQPGAEIIYDVKSTRNLAPWIRKHGGVPSL